MKTIHKTVWFGSLVATGVFCLHILGTDVFAGENPGDWRPIYDLVMRWVNFLILAFILVKFGKAPLMNFLRGEQNRFESEMRRLEKEKEKAVEKVKKTQRMLHESNERFDKLKERIIAQGEKKKQAIIEEAKRESRQMIEEAGRKIGHRLYQAKEQLRAELVDTATAVAMQRLAGELTEADNEKFISRFMDSIEA